MEKLDGRIYEKLAKAIDEKGFISEYYLSISANGKTVDFDSSDYDKLIDLLKIGLMCGASMLLHTTHLDATNSKGKHSYFVTFI